MYFEIPYFLPSTDATAAAVVGSVDVLGYAELETENHYIPLIFTILAPFVFIALVFQSGPVELRWTWKVC